MWSQPVGLLLVAAGGLFIVFSTFASSGGAAREALWQPLAWRVFGGISLLVVPGVLLVRRRTPISGPRAAEIRTSRSQARKATGMLIVLLSLLLGLSGAMSDEEAGNGRRAVLFVGAAALAASGILLAIQGDREIARGREESLQATIRAYAEEAATTPVGEVAEELPPGDRARLRELVSSGRLPLDAREVALACSVCGVEADVMPATLQKYTGLLVATEATVVQGMLCRTCIERLAAEFNAHCTLAGWWSPKAFLGTLLALPQNSAESARAKKMAAPPSNALAPAVGTEEVRRLRPHTRALVSAILAGDPPAEIYRATAVKSGTTPGQACRFAALLACAGS